jgi:hypothetical protein
MIGMSAITGLLPCKWSEDQADHHERRKSTTKIHPTPFPLPKTVLCVRWASLPAWAFVLVLGLVRHSIEEGGRGPRGVWRFCFSPFVMMTAMNIINEPNNFIMSIISAIGQQSSPSIIGTDPFSDSAVFSTLICNRASATKAKPIINERRKSATKIHPTPFPLFLKRFGAWAGLRALLGLLCSFWASSATALRKGEGAPGVCGAFVFRRS